MTNTRTVVLVGHCGPDMHMLRTVVNRSAPGTTVVMANSSADLGKYAAADHLLLVNRVLDGDFDVNDGIELIASVLKRESPPRAMLISNYAESQDQAVAAGATRGFGKSQLYAQGTIDALRAAIHRD